MRKYLGFILLLIVSIFTLVGCNGEKSPSLPELEGQTIEQIRETFNKKGLVVTLDFQDYFEKDIAEKQFHSYGQGFNVGDSVNPGDLITILVKSPTIRLPELKDLNREEIIEVFSEIGVTARELTLRPAEDISVKLGTFISYDGVMPGFEYDFSKKLVIYYDVSKELPNLEGKNIHQVNKELEEMFIDFDIKYVVDNTKEFDLFKEYTGKKASDRITSNDKVEVVFYKNDNVNDHENVVNDKDIFISKYVDGVNQNQAIELFNPTNETIDLSKYYLAILADGSFVKTKEVMLSGMLEPNKTHVVVSSGADEELKSKAQEISSDLIFDGNDVIQLRIKENNTYIDTIYDVGNVSIIFDNEVFIRKTAVTTNNREFRQSEWMGYLPTYLNPVGTHPWAENDLEGPTFVLMETLYKDYGMTLIEFTRAADGDTIYANSLDPRDKTSFQGDNRIRFVMVDTPETQKPGVAGEPYANVAHNFTNKLLTAATEIYIQADRASGLQETYGRHMGLIWFKIEEDISFDNIAASGNVVVKSGWHLLNYELTKHGLAEKGLGKTVKYAESPIFDNRYLYHWSNYALEYAIANKLGLYSGVNRS